MNKQISIKILFILISLIYSNSVVFPQAVKLTWKSSQETNVSHYNIYRSTHRLLNFHFIGASDNTHAVYTDDNVTNGDHFFYAATVVLQDGTESYFSNIAEVYIRNLDKNDVGFELKQNYPNPFNPSTNIHFSLTKPQFVTAKVYDIRGQEILTLFEGHKKAGLHKVVFDGKDMMNGVFFICVNAGGTVKTRRMILLK
ncbi:T9SS type A sorting domain-containing protein [candidate division KSB1 bacterium]|nr:T9SS type A sorting domain-containing protein [candidate division KSB1 bacterium]MBL7095411.1 T9SS type A sorting domain-containing protein [candidate division KSB1 bacterium]